MAKLTKGSIEGIQFQLNPTTIQEKGGGAVWNEIISPGLQNPIKQYSYGNSKELSFELYLNDKFSGYDVGAMYKNLNTLKQSRSPVTFRYGVYTGKYIIKELSMNIDRMNSSLTPNEIKAQIILAEF